MATSQIRYLSLLMHMFLVLSLSPSATAVEWQDVAGNLMSPACPGRTLLNCTSGQAEQWRELIRQKIVQGETKKQIMAYFVEMRGEEILASPPKSGFALTAWLFPVLIIVNGAGVIVLLTRRWARQRSVLETDRNLTIHTSSPSGGSSSLEPYNDRLQKELNDFTA